MRAITSVIVLAIFANAFCNMRPLSLKSLQTVPLTIQDIGMTSPDNRLTNYQGEWTAQPQAGKTVEGDIQANAILDIHVKEVEVQTKYLGAVVDTTTKPLGQDVAAGGNLKFKYQQYLARFVPSGAYILLLSFKDANGTVIGSAQVDFNMLPA